MARSFASQFASAKDAENCSALNNSGTIALVQNIAKCGVEPDVYKIGLAAAALVNAETLSVYISTPPVGVLTPSIYLQQGTILYFADPGAPTVFIKAVLTESITVVSVLVGTPVTINVEPISGAMTTAFVATTWGLIRLLGADDLGLNINAGTESTTNLQAGLKGQNETTSLMLDSSLSMILEPDDPGFWNIIHTAGTTGRHFFSLVSKPGGSYTWGECQAGNYTRPGAKQSIQKATVALNFQDNWVSPNLAKYLSAPELLVLQSVTRYAGLPEAA